MTIAKYHGCDSNTSPERDACHDDFYLGEMGMGGMIGDSCVYNPAYGRFNNVGNTANTLRHATWMVERDRKHTFGYWFLLGPQLAHPAAVATVHRQDGETFVAHTSCAVQTLAEAYNWGAAQARQALQAWADDYPQILGHTIYCDVEQATGAGWYLNGRIGGNPWYALNRQVIIGFVATIRKKPPHVGGVYADGGDWDQITNGWTGLKAHATAVWVAAWRPSEGCLPEFPAGLSLGGVAAQIWQYCGNPDYDAALDLPS